MSGNRLLVFPQASAFLVAFFQGAWCFAPNPREAPMLGYFKVARRRASSANRSSPDQVC
jgi:hypothetical protein